MEHKKKKKFIPNAVNIKADLHRLCSYIKSPSSCATSIAEIQARYEDILKKATIKSQEGDRTRFRCDETACAIIVRDSLQEFVDKSGGTTTSLKPIRSVFNCHIFFVYNILDARGLAIRHCFFYPQNFSLKLPQNTYLSK